MTIAFPYGTTLGGGLRPRLRLVGHPDADLGIVIELPKRPAIRLSRRTRILRTVAGSIVVVALVLLALPVSILGGKGIAPTRTPAIRGGAVVVVRSGDTLRSIAARVDPGANPTREAAKLASLIGSDTVVPGERLQIR